ncbi:MAG: class SAM-dependent methyltransferase, partial [Sediminibacterium sp.]|nr:class SAM-dependent methyltransferase [Sediminibacterium sp.]
GYRFFVFDTLDGLHYFCGSFYKNGVMIFSMTLMKDCRGEFIKGIFQDTLPGFMRKHDEMLSSDAQKVILMDADLYSATIFTLSQLYTVLRKGDIIMFDEFSVATHEFKAYTEFVSNFYINLKPVVAVNNFYQVGFEVA